MLLSVLTQASLLLLYPFTLQRLAITAVIYAAGTAISLYLLFHPRNQWLVANRWRVDCSGRPSVALTFDDGPSPKDTPRLLDILRDKQVPATFFVIGERAERYPEIVRRAAEEGHLIGNHTWSHRPLFCFLTPSRLREEIEKGGNTIEKACGYRPRYFRSPVGLRHPLLAAYLRDTGLEYISWRIRTRDTWRLSAETLTHRILDHVSPGDIILMHDFLKGGADAMLQALPNVIDQLRLRGYEFVAVGAQTAQLAPR